MRFGEQIKSVKNDLYVTPRYEMWLKHNQNAGYSPKALKFAEEELRKRDRVRTGTVSASSLDSCTRAQQFTFLGFPRGNFPNKTVNIFHNGTFMHLRWQMAGLSEGFVKEAEVVVPENNHGLHGTADGILDDDSVLELKSCNDNAFNRVVTFGPMKSHMIQVGAYVHLLKRERGVFIYENKNTQEYKEVIVPRDGLPLSQAFLKAEIIWELINAKKLAEPISAAYEGKYPCAGCQFYSRCLDVKSWEHAEEIRDEVAT